MSYVQLNNLGCRESNACVQCPCVTHSHFSHFHFNTVTSCVMEIPNYKPFTLLSRTRHHAQ